MITKKKNEEVTAIVICAGKGERWGGHLGIPKHFIEIDGEKILHRTIRLLKKNGVKNIFVVSDKDSRYRIAGTIQYIAKHDYEKNHDADKFLSSKELWSKKGRTIVIYGDCYFTDEAIEKIVNFKKRDWTLFCRPNPSKITGHRWGECFAQSFYPENIAEHEEKLHYIAELSKSGVIRRCGGWEHYRAMTGRTDSKVRRPHTMKGRYILIDDWTEDFDEPQDLNDWLLRRQGEMR
jgi:CTP:phosphocholine cytidylyltransferase-like protein